MKKLLVANKFKFDIHLLSWLAKYIPMQNIDTVLATITEKVLEKPVIGVENFNLTFAEFVAVGIIFAVAYGIYWVIKIFFLWQVRRDKLRRSQSRTLIQLAGYIITLVAVTYAFSAVGYSLTYLLVGSTALLVGLGFGLQQLFVDLISGVILLIDKNINYGDVVFLEAGSQKEFRGRIHKIGLRTTILETIDNEMVIIPNSKMLQTGIKSLMRGSGSVRFRINVLVAFNSDMQKVKELIFKSVKSHEKIESSPEPTIILKSFENDGVLVEVRFWMKELFNSENILSEVRFKILEGFQNAGIEIPFPQRVIHQAVK
jgi:small-conductance mechanosensitive channel